MMALYYVCSCCDVTCKQECVCVRVCVCVGVRCDVCGV